MTPAYEYAQHALIGIAPPQSNPTVEPELAALLPAGVNMVVTRLTGDAQDGRKRFHDYLDNLELSVAAFGAMKPDALGFACTSTGYLLGADEEDRRLAALSEKLGYPVISSSQAVRRALAQLGARTIHLISPYPGWLTEASVAYWSAAGHEVRSISRVLADEADLLDIYRLRRPEVMRAIENIDGTADVVLLAGTGMASLRVLPDIARHAGKPALSSNLCLAWALLDALDLVRLAPPTNDEALLGWRARAASLLGE